MLVVIDSIRSKLNEIECYDKECPLYQLCGTKRFQNTVSCVFSKSVAKIAELERNCKELKKKLEDAMDSCEGRCETCRFQYDCSKHDLNDSAPCLIWYTDCKDWKWMYEEDDE